MENQLFLQTSSWAAIVTAICAAIAVLIAAIAPARAARKLVDADRTSWREKTAEEVEAKMWRQDC